MLKEIIAVSEPAQLYAIITFIVALIFYRPKDTTGRLLWFILLLNAVTEVSSSILKYQKHGLGLLFTISLLIHNTIWLLLLSKSIKRFAYFKRVLVCYLLFAMFDFLFVEEIHHFNIYTFILGALLYVVLFIYESFGQLQQENFPFFLSNHYLLLFAPVLFFFGLSFVFGFNSHAVGVTIIFGSVTLYQFIAMFVNLIYYTLITIYIFREKKVKI